MSAHFIRTLLFTIGHKNESFQNMCDSHSARMVRFFFVLTVRVIFAENDETCDDENFRWMDKIH